MKTLYLDIFSGISGDMFVGALLDLGVDGCELERQLSKIGISGYHIHIRRAQKSGIDGIKFDVHVQDQGAGQPEHAASHHHHHHHDGHGHSHDHHEHSHGDHSNQTSQVHDHSGHRNFDTIKRLITTSDLSPWVKERSIAVFVRIAQAEGKIHGKPAEHVHFHEVGAVDSIIDVVGACLALEMLGKPRVFASHVVEGTGWIQCAHGTFPVPAPATLEILAARGIPVTQNDEPSELVTPTGAALLAEFVEHFGPMTNLIPHKIGFGLGTRENRTRPNVLRAILGETAPDQCCQPSHDWESDSISVLETNLDDVTPEIVGAFVELALGQGALDVYHAPVVMKKNRPGIVLTVLCKQEDADRFCELVLRETTAFGVRRQICDRRKLRREMKTVPTQFGDVTVKIGSLDGQTVQVSPEFESCKSVARAAKVSIKNVYEAVIRAAGF